MCVCVRASVRAGTKLHRRLFCLLSRLTMLFGHGFGKPRLEPPSDAGDVFSAASPNPYFPSALANGRPVHAAAPFSAGL